MRFDYELSLSYANAAKNLVEDGVGRAPASHVLERMQRTTKVRHHELFRQMTGTRRERRHCMIDVRERRRKERSMPGVGHEHRLLTSRARRRPRNRRAQRGHALAGSRGHVEHVVTPRHR